MKRLPHAITPDQVALIDQCEVIRAVDIRDLGLRSEPNIDVATIEDLLDLFDGIDADGRAL